jgi:hypothetical protein
VQLTGYTYNLKEIITYSPSPVYKNVSQDDLFLVSYPKSGNIWLRYILATLISSKKDYRTNLPEPVSGAYQTALAFTNSDNRPRIIKSHRAYTVLYSKVIYIHRDPRDVVISYYSHHKKYQTEFDTPLETYIREFVNGTMSPFGPWDKHLRSWMKSPLLKKNKLLILKYEDLKSDRFRSLKKISDFLSLNSDDEEIELAMESSSFDPFQNNGKLHRGSSGYFESFSGKTGAGPAGKGEWKNHFTPEHRKLYKSKFGQLLIDLGYEKDLNW